MINLWKPTKSCQEIIRAAAETGRFGTCYQCYSKQKDCLIRHDVDHSLEQAEIMAQYEESLGLKSTYFILPSAPYFKDIDKCMNTLRYIIHLGHEIGYHNNLVSQWVLTGRDPGAILEEHLKLFKDHWINITYMIDHGSSECHRYRFLNGYVFTFAKMNPAYPSHEMVNGNKIPKIDAEKFGLKVAFHFGKPFSDIKGDLKSLDSFKESISKRERIYISMHPDYWMERNVK